MTTADDTNPSQFPASPCINVCELDEALAMCIGCGRTIEEISKWPELDAEARAAVWEELPARLDQLKKHARSASIRSSDRN